MEGSIGYHGKGWGVVTDVSEHRVCLKVPSYPGSVVDHTDRRWTAVGGGRMRGGGEEVPWDVFKHLLNKLWNKS